MIFTIEPMINAGKAAIREMADGGPSSPGPQPFRPVGTHCPGYRHGLRGAHRSPPVAAQSPTGSSDELRRCCPARRGQGPTTFNSRQNYECSNDARALLRERCAQVDAVL